jgi:tetratricopeptide (TPR) repeat protein
VNAALAHAEPPRVLGVVRVPAVTPRPLGALVEAAGISAGTRVVAVDLSLGAWRARQAMHELAEQLGLEPRPVARPFALDSIGGYANFVGWAIDREAEGRRELEAAYLFVRDVAGVIAEEPTVVLFALPRFGLELEPADGAVLRFLAEAATVDERLRCVIVADTSATVGGLQLEWCDAAAAVAVPTAGVGALLPGILDAEVIAEVDALPLGGGHALVSPAARTDPRTVSRLRFDELARTDALPPWLRAYAQVHGDAIEVDPWFLWAQACIELAGGGAFAALRLVERAAACAADDRLKGLLAGFAQGIRIASERFAEAAAVSDPPAALLPPQRAFLLQTKGWGLVMSGDPATADAYFRAAYELLDPPQESLERLYLLNIWALARLRLGDVEGARRIEAEIAERHARLPMPDARLAYVNSMNRARVDRRRNELRSAARHYREAFATVAGLASPSDLLYEAVCLGRIHEALGERDAAFASSVRAGLYVAASRLPEAIARRVVATVCSGPSPANHERADRLAAELAAWIERTAAAAGVGLVVHDEVPSFLQAVALSELGDAVAVGGAGWSVVAVDRREPAPIETPANRRLRRLLAAVVGDAPTILVDDGCGNGLATDERALLAAALRLGCGSVQVNGRRLDLLPRRADLERACTVRPARGVVGLEPAGNEVVCTFRRYLQPLVAGGPAAVLLAAVVERERTVAELAELGDRPLDETLVRLRALEANCIVEVLPPADEPEVPD